MKQRRLAGRVLLVIVALTSSALADVEALNQQVVQLYREGQFDEAIAVAHQAITEAEATFGKDHEDTATPLNNLAALYEAKGRYDEALPLYQQAQVNIEKTLGPEHPDTAVSLNRLAMVYRQLHRYDEALSLFQRALVIREKALGQEHSDTATSLNELAVTYDEMGRYAEALPLYMRALASFEKALGPEHPDTATTRSNLAALYEAMGRYGEASLLYQRELAKIEKALGPEHPDTAVSLTKLAILYRQMGRNDEALPLYQRALAIRESALGSEHPKTAMSLNNLAVFYQFTGRYDEALPLLQRALLIVEKTGSEHDLMTNLSNLASFYQRMGRYEEALPLYQRALARDEKTLGLEHPDTAKSLNNLAVAYRNMGRFDEALSLLQRALAIVEKTRGLKYPSTAVHMNNLAVLYWRMGRNDEALKLFQQALLVRETVLGPEHQDTAASLNNLAMFYESIGRVDEALSLYRRAVRVVAVRDIHDPDHNYGAIHQLAVSSSNLADLLQLDEQEGALDEAIFYFKLSVNTRQRMRAGTRGLDAATRETFTQLVAGPYRALSALLIQRGRIAEAERVLLLLKESELTEYLRRNGSGGSAQEGLTWTVEEEAYWQDLEGVATEWRDFERRRLAMEDEIKRGSLPETGPEISEMDAKRIQLDTRARNIIAAATQRFVDASRKANEQHLQAFDSARTELSAKLTELRVRGDGGLRTVGLLLLPSERGLTLIVTTEQGAVPLISKVSEVELNALVKALRESILDRKDYRGPAEALYQHLIAPAETQLSDAAGIQHWAILPFGNLRAIPFAALMRPDGTHFIEHYAVTILTADGTGKLEGLETPARDTWHGVAMGASQADAAFGNLALPGVRREVCGVIREQSGEECRADEGLIDGKRYLDAAFTPELLQRLLGPASGAASFMHIATHFKLEKSLLLLGDGSRLTTGQILSWTPRLSQYDLIVLSACDSGLSEGALESLGGLFRSKGAKAVLATLWPVADVGAAPLMVEFYRQRGEKRAMSKAAALREAQLAMLRGRIKDEEGTADLRHPYFWAPYVLMGNWL